MKIAKIIALALSITVLCTIAPFVLMGIVSIICITLLINKDEN